MSMQTADGYRESTAARSARAEVEWARGLMRELQADDLDVVEPGLFCHLPDQLLYRQLPAGIVIRAMASDDVTRRGICVVVERGTARYLEPDTVDRTRSNYDRRKAAEAAAAEAATKRAAEALARKPLRTVTLAGIEGRRLPDVDVAIATIEQRFGGVVSVEAGRVLVQIRDVGPHEADVFRDAAKVIHAADPWLAQLLSAGKPVPAGVQITPTGIPVRDGKVVLR